MENHYDCKRQYIQLSRAWYGEVRTRGVDIVDEIVIGFYHPEGGTTGEFNVRWTRLNGRVVPELRVFEDSWSALWGFRDLLEEFAKLDGTNPGPQKIANLLYSLGVEDNTPEIFPTWKK